MSETQRVMAAAQASETITDATGRVIEVRQVTRRESMRLMRQWGAACNVQMWLGNALLAACARSVDGTPVPPIISPEHVEALVERLDDAGLEAVAEWLGDKSSPDAGVRDQAKN